MTTNNQSSWRDLFSGGRALAVTVFAGGVGLQAMEAFIGSTLLPSAVAEIGGIELFAWNSTLFIVAAIIASVFAAIRPFGIGPRGTYGLAAAGFGLGSLICALAPNMEIMLLGRAVQGFGGGLLTAMGYSMIRLVFPQQLWGAAFALISTVWGVATLVGPAVGGVFATLDAWRWAFFILVPLALLLGLLALRVIPRRSDEDGMQRFPVPQILLLVGAVLAVSVASVLTEGVLLSALLVGVAVLAIIVLGVIDRNGDVRLFPRGTFSFASALPALFAAMLLLNIAIVCDIFIPLFMQHLHGQSPLVAGYLLALTAAGWSGGSIVVSTWTGSKARASLALGPVLQGLGVLGLALFVGRDNTAGELLPLVPISIALFLLGLGIGISWPHVSTRLLAAAPEGEGDLTSVSMSMVQQFAGGLGAAVAGVIVNAAGLASGQSVTTAIAAANWLYGLFVVFPLLAIPIVWSIVRTEATRAVAQAAE
jgi:MFS family permease